jgi:hypothetical protein
MEPHQRSKRKQWRILSFFVRLKKIQWKSKGNIDPKDFDRYNSSLAKKMAADF